MTNDDAVSLPKNTLAFLIVSHIVVITPHISKHSYWVISLVGLCLVWRIVSNMRHWPLPGKGVRFLLVISGFSAVYLAYGTVIGPLAGVGLLLLAYTFKLLEAKTVRDAHMVVTLSYFVVATAFLFDQAFSKALYLLFSCVVISAALISINQPSTHWKGSSKSAFYLVLKSLPIMVVLFLFVPRIEAFWSIQFDNHHARMGLSDEMSPGDIARLGENDSVAFRAKFERNIPLPAERYWRALVLDDFDGRRWRHADRGVELRSLSKKDQDATKRQGSEYNAWFLNRRDQGDNYFRYKIIMEASDKPWLFALDWAHPLSANINMDDGFSLSVAKPLTEPFVYQVESLSSTTLTGPPDGMHWQYQRKRNLKLPASGNERSRQWAENVRKESGSDEAFISQILAHFREQKFYYTLRPPLLGTDSIDQFLFTTRRGFCEHYASTFTFLARSVGIPARVVVGYQGGEQSSLDNYLLVYQFDAHAWAEVWLPKRGWVRVDPTAAVSPARVEKGIEDALGDSRRFLANSPLSLLRYRDIPGVRRLRHSIDYLRMLWIQKVVGYNGRLQTDLFYKLFGSSSTKTVMLVLLGGLSSLLFLIFIFDVYSKRKPRMPPEQRLYLRFCRKLSKRGFNKGVSEGETAFAHRVAVNSPEMAEGVLRITALYVQINYRPLDRDGVGRKQRVNQFRKQVSAFSV
ncbi:MAG: DUF3488 domain-containing transglutaminase family protein [Pseudomonadales bacterium]|nr:DUF3488 domain-containing transglutaminase family protein [Pseudomonadales bacterium]